MIIMKRFLTFIAFAVLALQVSAKDITKTIDAGRFDSIEITSFFDVVIKKDLSHSVNITMSEALEEYLIARVNYDGTLVLGIDTRKMPLKMKMEKHNLSAVITVPRLRDLEISGMAKVTMNGEFTSDEFEGELSGSSNLTGLNMSAKEIKIECSGSSKVVATLDGREIDLSVSGGSSVETRLDASKVEVEVSGASRANLNGKTDRIDAEVSGASSLKAWNLLAKKGEVEASGASNAEMNVSDRFDVEAKGASTVTYPSTIKSIIEREVSGASSVKAK